MNVALRRVAAIVHRESGIRLTERQDPFLQAALDRMDAGSGAEAFLLRADDPLEGTRLVARLIEEVTVKETSFLRDRGQLESLDWPLLLANARARGSDRIRVWTAPCASGEEAYSLALLAHEAFAPAPPPVSIVATDISHHAIARARLGAYGPRSAGALDTALRARYFAQTDTGLVVGDKLRTVVSFSRHNLVADAFPPRGETPFDLILCRNLLIYFDAENVRRVLASFQLVLGPGGRLVLGAVDELCATAARLAPSREPLRLPRLATRPRRPLGRPPAAAPLLSAADHFENGLVELERNDPAAAVTSLRRALYVDPYFGLAAFKLGGAHEALGEIAAARRAYAQALRVLEPHDRHEPFLGQIALADVARAVAARLKALTPARA